MKIYRLIMILSVMILLNGCNSQQLKSEPSTKLHSNMVTTLITSTPFQPQAPIQISTDYLEATVTPPASQPDLVEKPDSTLLKVFIPDYLPEITKGLKFDRDVEFTNDPQQANCFVNLNGQGFYIGNYVLTIVAPFHTIQDSIDSDQFQHHLSRIQSKNNLKIIMAPEVHSLLLDYYGSLSDAIFVVNAEALFETANQSENTFAIIPFQSLSAKWKVIELDGTSVFAKNFSNVEYPLDFDLFLSCNDESAWLLNAMNLMKLYSNRDEEKMTSVLITGTTALTRATADKMEKLGINFPAEKIIDWFDQSDIKHVSSETSFYDGCPYPNAYQTDLSFCSRPQYLDLFNFLGVNVIELTGNHLLDKGVKPFEETLALFNSYGFQYYAGGFTIEEARQPLIIEHNGNRIAFIGCNIAGPPNVWVTEYNSGVNFCNLGELEQQVQELSDNEFFTIVTFQYFESNFMKPSDQQISYFRRMVDAGADIVSGSQSHVPMTMEIYQGRFIHYGLGNLFFDQMDYLQTRQEFLDRVIIYDQRLVGVELKTAMLEYFAQPRPMNPEERSFLLQSAFQYFTISE